MTTQEHDTMEWPAAPEIPPGKIYRRWPAETRAAILELLDQPDGPTVRDVCDHYDLSSSMLTKWRGNGRAPEASPVGEVPAVAEPDDDQALDDEAEGTIVDIEFDDTEIGILDALAYLHGQTRDDLVAALLTTYLTEQATHPHVVQAIALRTRWANTE